MTGSAAEQEKAVAGADFRHVSAWIFDLDNTLYRADNGVFAQIERRMTDYVMRILDLEREAAWVRQKDLYRRYGTTLNGLMQEHGCDAEDYLNFVHDIDLSSLIPDGDLAAALAALPGRRFVFTNGCRVHAARILARLEMDHLFEEVWDIRTLNFRPKPEASAYADVVAACRVDAPRAAMFDDIPRNLVPARALGMTTVWLRTDSPWVGHGPQMDIAEGDIDHETDNLSQFLHNIRTQS
ncbi:MAG: pyrimidine 5'-nucleotidase [Alphaproteobacteria bacterium 64-11]|nr:pyrimidine 5'-nucleotidase [Alphaproteobacteria bacterium]OJU10094.1 MAG: pyrimidine 5'-nucleotidase [Alphaproteobacteria bacterium 64-11]